MKIKNINLNQLAKVLSVLSPAFAGKDARLMLAVKDGTNVMMLSACNGEMQMAGCVAVEVEEAGNVILEPQRFASVVAELAKAQESAELMLDTSLTIKAGGSQVSFPVFNDMKKISVAKDTVLQFKSKAVDLLNALLQGGRAYDGNAKGDALTRRVNFSLKQSGDDGTITVYSTDNHAVAYAPDVTIQALQYDEKQFTDEAKDDALGDCGFSLLGDYLKAITGVLNVIAEDKQVEIKVNKSHFVMKAGAFSLCLPVSSIGILTIIKMIRTMVDDAENGLHFEIRSKSMMNALSLLNASLTGNKEKEAGKIELSPSKEGFVVSFVDGTAQVPIKAEFVEGEALEESLHFNLFLVRDVVTWCTHSEKINITILNKGKVGTMVVDAGTHQALVLSIAK